MFYFPIAKLQKIDEKDVTLHLGNDLIFHLVGSIIVSLFIIKLMIALYIVALVLMAIAVGYQLKRDLMMLQQNSYRNDRYRSWLVQAKESTRFDRLIGYIIFFTCLVPNQHRWWYLAIVCLFAIANIWSLTSAHYKKPLVWTKRAKRIYGTEIAIVGIVWLIPLFFLYPDTAEGRIFNAMVYLVLCYSASQVITLFANWLLKPVEKKINDGFYDQAQRTLQSMPDLKIVGITGSYGKTSTKHYLYRILSEHCDVIMTPGNFNTLLGVTRTINENLRPYNQVFLVEMGAKQHGDIKEICDLVHPSIGIITAVGPQHLESFGTIKDVQQTKFELVDSLPADGLAVLNNDFEMIANRPVSNVKSVRYTAEDLPDADFKAVDIKYQPHGTTFRIEGPDDYAIELSTKLVGRCNVSNLIAAVIVAKKLGVPDEKIKYAVEKIEPVEHRLSMKRTPGGITIIDDAYNSNPVGSAMAMEVLSQMGPGQRIVITPGMIELGDKQKSANQELGRNIAHSADIAIVVGEYNKDAILEGINEVGMPEGAVRPVPTFAEAQQLLMTLAKSGDVVLYENDLPDTFK